MFSWAHFIVVVTGQLLVVLAMARYRSLTVGQTGRLVCLCMLLGLPLGLVYDILIGKGESFFFYQKVPENWLFTVINGTLSYGFAVATAWLFPLPMPACRLRYHTILGACFVVVAALIIVVFLRTPDYPLLIQMFLVGLALLMTSEGIALAFGFRAPLFSVAMGHFQPIQRVWLASIFIGAIYELLNFLFPLWHWQLVDTLSVWQAEALIIIFGYFTLFLPMFVVSRLVIKNIGTQSISNICQTNK